MSATVFASLVAAGVVLAAVAVFALAVLALQARTASRLKRRLNPGGVEAGEFDDVQSGEVLRSIATGGKKLEALVDTNNESARLLMQAGWRAPHQRAIYYASQVLTPLALLGVVLGLVSIGPAKLAQPQLLLLWVLGALMLGLLLPRMVLRSRAAARLRRIKREVPLLIHLLVLLFEAGLSTRQAFASLVREGSGVLPEIGREFEILLRQMEAGGDTSELLDNLAKGLAQEDLGGVLALLRQVDRYGGEVRDPLLEALKVIEERRTLDMREMVNLMSGRMTVVMVLFFFPALLIFVAGPAALAILRALADVTR